MVVDVDLGYKDVQLTPWNDQLECNAANGLKQTRLAVRRPVFYLLILMEVRGDRWKSLVMKWQ